MISAWAIGLLGLTLLLSNLFWAWQVHLLVDKVMSRNYAEYQQAQAPVETVREGLIPVPDVRQDLGSLSGFGVG